MSSNGADSTSSVSETPEPARRRNARVRTLLVLIACCAAIFWAWRYASENLDPVRAEARAIQNRAIGALKSAKTADRLSAIHELERLQRRDESIAVSAIAAALDDEVAEVRVSACYALQSIGSAAPRTPLREDLVQAAVTALVRGLKDSEKDVRVAAAEGLGLIAARSVGPQARALEEAFGSSAPALAQCLQDSDPRVRSVSLTALGKLGAAGIARQTVNDALGRLLRDRDVATRLSAVTALSQHDRRAAPSKLLLEAVKDSSPEIRGAVISGLNPSRAGLDPWVPVLLRLAEHDPDSAVRDQCIRALGLFGPPAITPAVVPDLIGSVKSPDVQLRQQAITILGKLGPNAGAAIPELLSALTEPVAPFDAGSAAAVALGQIGPKSAAEKKIIASLTDVVRSGPVSRRGSAAGALGEFGPMAEDAVPVLIELLHEAMPDDSFYRAWWAARALGRIAPSTRFAEKAVTALRVALDAQPPSVRASAVEALSCFGAEASAAIPRISALKEDRDRDVRDAAAKALRILK